MTSHRGQAGWAKMRHLGGSYQRQHATQQKYVNKANEPFYLQTLVHTMMFMSMILKVWKKIFFIFFYHQKIGKSHSNCKHLRFWSCTKYLSQLWQIHHWRIFQGDQKIWKKLPIFSKSSQNSLQAKKCQNIYSKTQFKSSKTSNHTWNLKIPQTNKFWNCILWQKCNVFA